MAHKKAGGTAKNLRDSQPKFLGIKIPDGGHAGVGAIIVRQRGTKILAGQNVGLGRDHTLFALRSGRVKFQTARKGNYDGSSRLAKRVSVE